MTMMESEKVVMERILERQPQESVVMVGGRKGSEVVDVKIRNRRFAKSENKNCVCSPPKIISILCIVIMVQVYKLLLERLVIKTSDVLIRLEHLSS